MESTNKLTNIEMFNSISQENTNIITTDNIKETLKGHSKFDWEEFNKPYAEVDFVKCAKSVDMNQIASVWTPKTFKTQVKSAIQSYEMKKGHLLSIGYSGNKFNNLLIIKNVQSQYCSHGYAFGDDAQKKQLTTNIDDLEAQGLPLSDLRKLSKTSINFLLHKQTGSLQHEQTLEQFKYVSLIKELITIQIGLVHDPKKTTPNHVCDGVIKAKYDEKLQEDITKFNATMQLLPIKGAEWDTPVQVVNIVNPDKEYNEELGITPEVVNTKFKNISQAMKALNNKSMDIIIQIDTANVKKQGKELTIIPKIKIVQITTRGVSTAIKKTFGLNLSAFKQVDEQLPVV